MDHRSLKDILFVMQLPPPVHGVSVMNKIIRDSQSINAAFNCDYVNLATAKNIDDIQKAGIRKYFLTLKIIFSVLRRIVFKRYRYVYITIFPWGFAFYKDSLIVLLCRLFGQKPLLHLHTHGFKTNSQGSGFKSWYYKFVFKNAEVICLSDLLIEDIELIYKGPVYILPNGIPQVNFENTYTIQSSPLSLLYLSNLIKGKGILLLIDAMEILKKRGVSFHFRIAGPEGDVTYAQLKDLVKEKQLDNEVSFIGPKFGEEKFMEFRNASVFLLPSNYDTFGLVLLEAMQFGVPCIASHVGGIPDVLGQGRGIILPELSPVAIADAIEHLAGAPEERSRMSKDGFNYFKANFTVQKFEDRLIQILHGKPEKISTQLSA